MLTSIKYAANELPAIFIFGWIIYLLIYWRTLWRILLLRHFDVNDRILWFLVITMAPIIGIITFYLQVNPPRATKNNNGTGS